MFNFFRLRCSWLLSGLSIATLCSAPAPAHSQGTWPVKPVRIIVGTSQGGSTDAYARLMGAVLSGSLNQQFVTENRPGGNGNIAAEAVARAAPDGYTVYFSASPSLITNPQLYKNLPFNAEKDFVPVAAGVISPLMFVVHPSIPARSMSELVALGKKMPGKFNYGSAAEFSNNMVGVRLLEDATGAKFTNIPYKGTGQATQNLLSGEISFMFAGAVTVLPQLRAGKLIALAISNRVSQLPNVPSLEEAGYPEAALNVPIMVVAPTGTPGAIVLRLNSELNRLMKTPEVAAKLDAMVFVPIFDTSAEFGARLAKEREKWAGHIHRLGLKGD